MKCRECGSEIADKALVCYKCGTATTEPKFRAPAGRPGKSRRSGINLVVNLLALVLLVLSALYMQRMVTVGAPPELRWLIVIGAAVLVALRLVVLRARR